VCANLAEAWRRRRYEGAFVSKLNDCEAEAAETQTWVRFAEACSYITPDVSAGLYAEYDAILGMLVRILTQPKRWAQ
jgi:four helix bundle protein